jgi:transcriptional regulator with XRE-family HTH domain
MRSVKVLLQPGCIEVISLVGANIKLARKRRNLSMAQVAERAAIPRAVLIRIEKGDPWVSLGFVFNVLSVLGLQEDLSKIAADDFRGRRIEELDHSIKTNRKR